jgi:dTDP-4-amino-4,6-dideoxygalactose transaminase
MTTSGRYAIALALEHIGLKPGDVVLIPAYHCEAMVVPVKWMGLKPAFYSINADTSINLGDIRQKINANVKVIIVTHYFGFLQDLKGIRALCDQYGIHLIEDCAHAFFGDYDNQQVAGKVGDYTIASSMKFLPLYEGGLLCSETIDLKDIKMTSPSIGFQLKSLINTLERSLAYNRLGFTGKLLNAIFSLKSALLSTLKKISQSSHAVSSGPSSSDGGYGLDEEWIHKLISWPSQLIIRLSDLNNTAHRRRENYQKMHATLAKLQNCHPLFETLPQQVVPWVYPLYVNDPAQCFGMLKKQGVPIWRFGEFLDAEVDQNTCSVSVDYSKHIFQFPCHQSLTDKDIDWMLSQITQTLTEA